MIEFLLTEQPKYHSYFLLKLFTLECLHKYYYMKNYYRLMYWICS